SAGPDDAESQGPETAVLSAEPLPRTVLRRALHAGATDDDERGGFSGSMVRDGCPESHDVGFRNHRDVSWNSVTGHGLCPAAPLHGRNRRCLSLVGIQPGRNWGDLERDCRGSARGWSRDSHASSGGEDLGEERASLRGGVTERRRDFGVGGVVERRSAPYV